MASTNTLSRGIAASVILASAFLLGGCKKTVTGSTEPAVESGTVKTRMLGESEWRTVPKDAFSPPQQESQQVVVVAQTMPDEQPAPVVQPERIRQPEPVATLSERVTKPAQAPTEGWYTIAASEAFEAADTDDDQQLSRKERKRLEKEQKQQSKEQGGAGFFGRSKRSGDAAVKEVAREWQATQPVAPEQETLASLGSMSLAERRLKEIVRREEELYAQVDAAEDPNTNATLQLRGQQLVSDYESLIADNPDMLEAIILYGKLLRKLGQDQRAFDMFELAHKLDPNIAVVKQQLGAIYAENGLYVQALELFRQAIEIDQEPAIYHYQLAELLNTYRREFEADGIFPADAIDRIMLRGFETAARLEPENRDFRMRWGESYFDLSEPRWEEALSVWTSIRQQARRGVETDASKLQIARVLVMMGDPAKARRIVENIEEPVLAESKQRVMALIEEAGG